MNIAFTVVDWVLLLIIFVFVVISLVKGFIDQLFSKSAWILGIIAAIFLYSKLAVLFFEKINNMIICNILSFIAIFAATYIILRLIGLLVQKIVDITILKGLDRIFGAAFGLIEGFAIVCLIMFLINLQPFFDGSKILDDSWFYGLMNKFIPQIKEVIANV